MVSKAIVLTRDPDLLAILDNSFFRREQFAMTPVDSVDQGVAAIEAEGPALAIFALQGEAEATLAGCRRLKADPLTDATAIILVLPEHADDALADACWEAGCDALVFPPVSGPRLLDAACALLGINRRLARRFPVEFALEFSGEDHKVHEATVINLNLGGMFLAAERLFPADARLILSFTLPGFRSPLQLVGRVAWVNHPEWLKKNSLPCGMGVQFIELSGNARQVLQVFLDSLPTRDERP